MRLSIDKEADALFLVLREGPWSHTKRAAEHVNLEIGPDGQVMAIEVFDLKRLAGQPVLEHLDLDFAPNHGALEVPIE